MNSIFFDSIRFGFGYLRFADPDDTPNLSSLIKLLLLKLIHHLQSLWHGLAWLGAACWECVDFPSAYAPPTIYLVFSDSLAQFVFLCNLLFFLSHFWWWLLLLVQ